MGRMFSRSMGLIGLSSLLACGAPASDGPDAPDMSYVPDMGPPLVCPTEGVSIDASPQKLIDVLFVIDNSVSMTPKQRVLAQSLSGFIRSLELGGWNYHLGVVTTNVGANPSETSTFPGNRTIPGCSSFSGDDGVLQNTPCTNRTGLSSYAQTACLSLCPDPKFVPSGGARYIEKQGSVYNVPSAKDSMGNEIGASRAFGCLGLVGDSGCGVESPLEAARRALDGHRSENTGFLRRDSVLAVLFITDEDDCSVQLGRRGELDPMTMNCAGNTSPDAPASCFGLDYRCLARSIECFAGDGTTFQPMTVAGAKTNCRQKADSFLTPVSQYVSFFSSLRNPGRLVVAGIISPSILDAQSGSGSGQLIVEQNPAGLPGTPGLVRGYKSLAACYNAGEMVPLEDADKGFIGQAQIRLSSFLRSFPSKQETSICSTSAYLNALSTIASRSQDQLAITCTISKPPRAADGTPACAAGFVEQGHPEVPPASLLPACSPSCCGAWKTAADPRPSAPAIAAACAAEAQDCFCIEENPVCSTAVGGIWRKGGQPYPAGQTAAFDCSGYWKRPAGCK